MTVVHLEDARFTPHPAGLAAPLQEPQDLRDLFHQRHKAARARLLSVVVPPLAPKALPEPVASRPAIVIRILALTRLRRKRAVLVRPLPPEITGNPVLLRRVIRKLWESGLTWPDMRGHARVAEVCAVRHDLIHLVKTYVDLNYNALGRLFNRDHATIRYALGMKGAIPLVPSRLRQSIHRHSQENEESAAKSLSDAAQ